MKPAGDGTGPPRPAAVARTFSGRLEERATSGGARALRALDNKGKHLSTTLPSMWMACGQTASRLGISGG